MKMDTIIDADYDDVFESSIYAEAYIKYRWMPYKAFIQYFKATKKYYPSECQILDIGAGTGQISIRLSGLLRENGINHCIDAIDPSLPQLNILNEIAKEFKLTSINTVNTSFEDYNILKKYDIIICSEIIHLVKDLRAFCEKLCKYLKDNGTIFIRTPSPKQLWERHGYDFFPACRYIDLSRNKGRELIDTAFSLFKKNIINEVIIDESQLVSKEFYIDMFKKKVFSTLHAIQDSEYNNGMELLLHAVESREEIYCDFWMTLYIVK